MWRRARQEIKDVLFPVFCEECGREGEWWCKNCRLDKINKPIVTGADGDLDCTAALLNYQEDGVVGRLIKQFKYHFIFDMADLWREIIGGCDLDKIVLKNFDNEKITIIPIPLHSKRKRERGFNQSEILAKIFLAQLKNIRSGVDLDIESLIRIRPTAKQAKLSKMEREKNIVDAFAWVGVAVSKNIILVDDVFTTGSTMRECAKILKQSGAKRITALTLARGQIISAPEISSSTLR